MATNTQCPSCLGVIRFDSGFAICDSCGVEVNLATHTASLTDKAPTWVRESYKVLCEICENKPMFVFGKQQLFTTNFKAKDCVAYTSSKYIGKDTPGFFIAFNGVTSRFLKILLTQYVNAGDNVEDLVRNAKPEVLLSIWLMSSFPIGKEPYSFEIVKTLSAIMAPTWIDCAEALFGNIPKDFSMWTESEILYSYMICNKLTLLRGVEYSKSLSVIKEVIKTQVKFIHGGNDKLSYDSAVVANRAYCNAMCKSIPELFVANRGSIGNDNIAWLFGTNSVASIPSDTTVEELAALSETAEGLHHLWRRYGESNSRAVKRLLEINDGNGIRESYIKYWEKVRSRLQ